MFVYGTLILPSSWHAWGWLRLIFRFEIEIESGFDLKPIQYIKIWLDIAWKHLSLLRKMNKNHPFSKPCDLIWRISTFLEFDLIRDLVGCCADIFDYAEYATTTVPSYPCGQIGFILARKGESRSCRSPVRIPTFQQDLKWYNPEMHRAAFVLPQYVKKELDLLMMYPAEDDDDGNDVEGCFLTGCVVQ